MAESRQIFVSSLEAVRKIASLSARRGRRLPWLSCTSVAASTESPTNTVAGRALGQRQVGNSRTPLVGEFALAPRFFLVGVHVDFLRVSTRDREPVLLYAAPGMSFLD